MPPTTSDPFGTVSLSGEHGMPSDPFTDVIDELAEELIVRTVEDGIRGEIDEFFQAEIEAGWPSLEMPTGSKKSNPTHNPGAQTPDGARDAPSPPARKIKTRAGRPKRN